MAASCSARLLAEVRHALADISTGSSRPSCDPGGGVSGLIARRRHRADLPTSPKLNEDAMQAARRARDTNDTKLRTSDIATKPGAYGGAANAKALKTTVQ